MRAEKTLFVPTPRLKKKNLKYRLYNELSKMSQEPESTGLSSSQRIPRLSLLHDPIIVHFLIYSAIDGWI